MLLYLTMINIHRFGKLFSQQFFFFFLILILLGKRSREERGTGFDFLWNLVLIKLPLMGLSCSGGGSNLQREEER